MSSHLRSKEEVNRSAAETSRRVAANRLQHATIERKIAGIVSAIEDGAYCRALSDRLGALEREKESLSLLVAEGIAPVVRIHPRLADIYAEKVAKLETALNDPAYAMRLVRCSDRSSRRLSYDRELLTVASM